MNRRQFVKAVSAITALRSIAVHAAGNPKVVFFGMSVVRSGANPLSIVLPATHGHAAFMVASPAVIQALGGTPVSIAKSGLDEAHQDLKGALTAWCMSGISLAVGSGNASVDARLASRLPSVTKMAQTFNAATAYAFRPTSLPPATCSASLGGGTLREPSVPSRCAATHKGVDWTFFAGPSKTQIAGPINVTDIAVFESASPTLRISVGDRAHTLNADESIWIVNMPISNPPDTTPQVIEDAHDWMSLVTPTFSTTTVTAETKQPVTRLKGSKPFVHPCAVGKSQVSISYIPPDTDPCFMVSE